MDLFEAGSARDADGGIDEMAVTGAADAYAVHIQDAVHPSYCPGNFLLQAFGSHIEQRVHGAPAELGPDPNNDAGNGEAREGVRVG